MFGREPLDRRNVRTRAAAWMACFEFIEGWHDPSRRHSALEQGAPVPFGRKAWNELTSATI